LSLVDQLVDDHIKVWKLKECYWHELGT